MRVMLAVVALASACIDSKSVVCDDGRFCPAGTTCRTLTNPTEQICATPDQTAACAMLAQGDLCSANDTMSRCYDGVCWPAGCGNGRLDPDEVCDDGNPVIGDGCSYACHSDETCGNGFLDPITLDSTGTPVPSEECDDSNALGHDGCSNGCRSEVPEWVRLTFVPQGGGGTRVALIYDPVRDRVTSFGGLRVTGLGISIFTDELFQWSGATWVNVPATVRPPPRTSPAVYDTHRHRVVVFGGNGGATFGDTWEWDGTSWITRTPASSPPARSGHAMVYDPIRKRAVVFGGVDADGHAFDDTWSWDGTIWRELAVTTRPAARSRHAMAFDPERGVIVLTGGQVGGQSGDTWEFDGSAWNHVGGATTPNTFIGTAMAFDPMTHHMITFGGTDATQTLSADAWMWDGTTWSKLAGGPPKRTDAAMVADPQHHQTLLYGGEGLTTCGACSADRIDLWSFDGNEWNELTPGFDPDAFPPTIAEAATAYDPVHDRVVMYGGTDGTSAHRDTWIWDRDGWRRIHNGGPLAERRAGLAYDVEHDRFVLFGGEDSQSTNLAETWLFDGDTWTQVTTGTMPPARMLLGMAYDATERRVVMTGGLSQGGSLTDTWEWDGAAWSPRTNAAPGLDSMAMTYDPKLGAVVCFAGEDSSNPFGLHSLYRWDHATGAWIDLTPTSVPSGRYGTGLVWNAARGQLLAFAGKDGPVFNDSWEWGGTAWAPVQVSSPPPARHHFAMIPNASGGGATIVGGQGQTNNDFLSDVWTLRWSSSSAYEACTADVDLDGDGLAGCADPDCWTRCTPLCPPNALCDPTWPHCGDGTCNTALESCRSCPADCGTCPAICGDSFCDAPETALTCPGDCTP